MKLLNSIKVYLFSLYRYFQRKKFITIVLGTENDIYFDERDSTFTIPNAGLNWDDKTSLRRRVLIIKLRQIHPSYLIKLKDIKTVYYDRCLVRYLYEKIKLGKADEDTCMFKVVQRYKCIGWVEPDNAFSLEDKKEFCKKIFQRNPNFKKIPEIIEKLEKRPDGFVFLHMDNVNLNYEKFLNLYRQIEKDGFSNIISSLNPIVLGYSTLTGHHIVTSGRHRIAILKYLQFQNKISGNFTVRCHQVKYAFESLIFTRPYTDECKECIESGSLLWTKNKTEVSS